MIEVGWRSLLRSAWMARTSASGTEEIVEIAHNPTLRRPTARHPSRAVRTNAMLAARSPLRARVPDGVGPTSSSGGRATPGVIAPQALPGLGRSDDPPAPGAAIDDPQHSGVSQQPLHNS